MISQEQALFDELGAVIDEKKTQRDPLIEILHKAQELFGYLPRHVLEFVSERAGVPLNQVCGVVTFYNFFSTTPRGKYVINVCMGTACYVKGAPRLLQMLEEELGIKLGETTEDRKFTLQAVRCVGACSLAPVFGVGEDTFGRVDSRKKLHQVLSNLT